MGELLSSTGNMTAACPLYERALTISEHKLAANHPMIQRVRDNLNKCKGDETE
jgi:hypothetical protein